MVFGIFLLAEDVAVDDVPDLGRQAEQAALLLGVQLIHHWLCGAVLLRRVTMACIGRIAIHTEAHELARCLRVSLGVDDKTSEEWSVDGLGAICQVTRCRSSDM